MSIRHQPIGDIKLRDISLFLELTKTLSVRELARRHNLQPGQISKLIKGLEQRLNTQLVERSIYGITPTSNANECIFIFEQIEKLFEQLQHRSSDQLRQLTFASTSFFSTHLLPEVFSNLNKLHSDYRFRLLDLPPSQFIAAGLRRAFQVCIHVDKLDWPKTWASVQIGALHWVLCARKNHPLTKKARVKDVLRYPFVYPIYWSSEGVIYGNDHCPVPIKNRIRGTETATATSAAEIVKQSDQVGFLPEIMVRPLILRKEIQIIEVSEWKKIQQPVYLTVKADSIHQKMFNLVKENCQSHLAPSSK